MRGKLGRCACETRASPRRRKSNANGPGIEVLATGGDAENTDFGPFDDEETRAFYCVIPDFVVTVPPALLGLTPEAIETKKLQNASKYGEADDANEIVDDASVQEDLLAADDERLHETEMGGDTGAQDGGPPKEEFEGMYFFRKVEGNLELATCRRDISVRSSFQW
jgi:hypothetical protein